MKSICAAAVVLLAALCMCVGDRASAQQPTIKSYCGASSEIQLREPAADVPDNFRRFFGTWQGTEVPAGGSDGPCFTFAIESVGPDGSVSMVIFNGSYPQWNMFGGAARKPGKIVNDSLEYLTGGGVTTYLDFKGDHLEMRYTSPSSGRKYTGIFKKI